MLAEKALKTIRQYNMLSPGDKVAVCLSGGADSMALFHFLCTHREKLEIEIMTLHVNHGLREESGDEQLFVADYCRKMGAQCIITALDMNNKPKPQGLSTETWARDLRYQFFFQQADKLGAKLATAHTLSDRAETVLFNITRGSSLKGAAGIPPVRDNIIRPLIDCSRADVEKYCSENGIPFVTDQTNFQDIYSSREVYSLLDDLSNSVNKKAVGLGGLDVTLLQAEHPAVTKNLIRNNLDKLGCLSKDNVETIYSALWQETFKRQLSADTFCRIKDGRLSFYTPQTKPKERMPDFVPVKEGEIATFGHTTLYFSVISSQEYENFKKNNKNYLTYRINYDILKGDVGLRSRKTGDTFTFVDRNVTKTLKKLFIEDKIPQSYRDKIPVLVDGTDAVVWLGDYGTNKPFVPDENTKNILLITQM